MFNCSKVPVIIVNHSRNLSKASFRSKMSFLKNSTVNKPKKSRKLLKLASASTLASVLGGSALVIIQSNQILDENLPLDAMGPIYKFQENEIGDYLPLDYNVPAIEAFWKKRPLEVIQRTGEILSILVPYFSKLVIWEYLIRTKIRQHNGLQKKYAIRLREILTELGPCFIKFGQAMSIRPDLLPSPFLFELQKLCDSVPSFPTTDAISVIEAELGPGAASKFFEDLKPDTPPIAAASLGQVYKLKLKSDGAKFVEETSDIDWCRCSTHCTVQNDTIVAVKVQRPDMLSFVLRDLFIMRNIAKLVEKVKSTLTKNRPYDVGLLDTFASASLKELDYINEAANQEFFRRELMHRMGSKVYIPAVHDKLTTRKVLVTEWIEGNKLAQSEAEIINRLTPVGVECFLAQLLETGQFHADPHPGNLLVTTDGRLALIDFGLCAEVPLPDTKTMTLAIVHLMQGDVSGLLEDAIELGFLPQDVDKASLLPALEKIFDDAQLAMKEESQVEAIKKAKYKAIVTRRKRFMAVSNDLNSIFFNYPFLVPDYFALITRAMIVLEGIAVTGNPEFDLYNSAYPFALKRAISLFGLNNLSKIALQMTKNNDFLKIPKTSKDHDN